MLDLQNINVTFAKGGKLERKILSNLNLKLNNGEFVVVIGENGAGKSTIFNIISGFLKQDSGKVIIDAKDVTLVSKRAKLVSKVMQDPRIGTMENMTILENMAFAFKRGSMRDFLPFSNMATRELFKEKLFMLNMGLENRLDEVVANLSGGQRQALSLIMAILADSKILLLDEITAALDPKIAENVMKIAARIIKEEKRTCIMITHNMQQAIEYGDRLLVLKDGGFVKNFSGASKRNLTSVMISAEFGL